MATGRGPVTTGLGAEEAGIKMERGYIKVDELYRTSVPNVSAIGDVITLGTGVAPAARARLVDGGHHHRGAHRREGRAADQLRPRARAAPTATRRSAASVSLKPKQGSVATTCRIGTFPFGVLGRAQDGGRDRGVREDRRR